MNDTIRRALINLAQNMGNANITLHANDDGTFTASVWYDAGHTVIEATHENAEDSMTDLLNMLDQTFEAVDSVLDR